MKPNPWNLGACGVEQMIFAGSVKYNDTGIADGIKVCDLPDNIIVTKAVAVVTTAFNAGTTNVLTVGTNDDADNLLGSGDITEGTAAAYAGSNKFVKLGTGGKVNAKYTQTGTDATAGAADIYLFVVRIPA